MTAPAAVSAAPIALRAGRCGGPTTHQACAESPGTPTSISQLAPFGPGVKKKRCDPVDAGAVAVPIPRASSVTARATLSMSPSAYARIGRWYRRGLARRLLVAPALGKRPLTPLRRSRKKRAPMLLSCGDEVRAAGVVIEARRQPQDLRRSRPSSVSSVPTGSGDSPRRLWAVGR